MHKVLNGITPGFAPFSRPDEHCALQAAVQPQTISFAPAQLARFLAYLTQGTMGSQQAANTDAAGESRDWLRSMLADSERLEAAEGHSAEASSMLMGPALALPRCALCSCYDSLISYCVASHNCHYFCMFPRPDSVLFVTLAPDSCVGAAKQPPPPHHDMHLWQGGRHPGLHRLVGSARGCASVRGSPPTHTRRRPHPDICSAGEGPASCELIAAQWGRLARCPQLLIL